MEPAHNHRTSPVAVAALPRVAFEEGELPGFGLVQMHADGENTSILIKLPRGAVAKVHVQIQHRRPQILF